MSTIVQDLNTLQGARDDMKTALENKGMTVTNDIRTYANAIANIPSGSGSGDVKLFDTVEHMQADPNPSEGDLAVVYREELTSVTEESEFDSCTFPNTVVLDEAFTGDIYASFRAVDRSVMFDGMVEMSSSRFRFNGYGESAEIRIEYESQDGMTYTRTDGGNTLQEFGVIIKWEDYGEEFNSVIGNFMKIGGNYFEGMYEYKGYKNEEYAEAYSNVRYINDDITFDTTNVYISDLVELIHSKEEDIKSATGMSGGITDITIVKTAENQFTMYTFYGGSSYGQRAGGFVLYNNNLYAYGDNFTTNIYKFTINTSNNTVTYDGKINYDTTVTINTYTRYCVLLDNVSPVFMIYQSGGTIYRNQRELLYTSDNIGTNIKTYDIYTPTKATMYEYKLTSTQLDAIADYVYGKTFYGKNGVEEGTLQNGIISNTNTRDIFLYIGNKFETGLVVNDGIKFLNLTFSKLPFNLDTSNVTNMRNMFASCTNLTTIPQLDTSNVTNMEFMFKGCSVLATIPQLNTSNVTIMKDMFGNCSTLTTIPLLDTSNVTNMVDMFYGCSSLTEIPLLDTSNVTLMRDMFYDCGALITIPLLDTSNVTDMGYIFFSCINLTTIPQLNTGNVTNMEYMFYGCTSLTETPQLNTSKVTKMFYMFNGCTNLITIPLLDTSNVTNMGNMFYRCTSLSNTSLNNILAMCTNATKVTSYKTLKDIGLTEAQANICKTLSNYSAFTSAGWTTGY